jgi:hypothetical protein
MGFHSSLAGPDIWLCPVVKPNEYKYYEYVLAYVDDILAISYDPKNNLFHLSDFYCLKDGFDKPTHYAGAQVKEWRFPYDPVKIRWALASEQCVMKAIRNIEEYLSKELRHLRHNKQPFPCDYFPKLDDTPLLNKNEEEANHYMSHISILHWMVKFYINIALLSSFLMQPRMGYLEAVYGIYGYLKHHNHSTMAVDDQEIN